MLVRVQPPQLRTKLKRKSSGLDEEPVSKTGGDTIACGFESHGFRFLLSGSWSNRKTSVPHTENPGATPGESTYARQSRGPTATTLGSHPGNDGSIPSGTT